VGQPVGQEKSPSETCHFLQRKTPDFQRNQAFLELLGRFELPTSSLPTRDSDFTERKWRIYLQLLG